jgi:hypothetical protein
VIKAIDSIWRQDGLHLWLLPYRCVVTGEEGGLLEVVEGKTLLQIMRLGSGTKKSGFLREKAWISKWLEMENPDPVRYSCLPSPDVCFWVRRPVGAACTHKQASGCIPNMSLLAAVGACIISRRRSSRPRAGAFCCPTRATASCSTC